MKSDIDIKDDIFQYLKGNVSFWNEMRQYGFNDHSCISLLGRTKSQPSEIVVSILANGGATELQEAYVNVNVYVRDMKMEQATPTAGTVENRVQDLSTLKEICQICSRHLSDVLGDTFKFTISSQRVFQEEGTEMSFVNNKLLYNQINL